jgi:hypothetical protein
MSRNQNASSTKRSAPAPLRSVERCLIAGSREKHRSTQTSCEGTKRVSVRHLVSKHRPTEQAPVVPLPIERKLVESENGVRSCCIAKALRWLSYWW